MKNSLHTKKLISSIVATMLLLYFMVNSSSPKIIFIPFLICSIAAAGKSFARIYLIKNKLLNRQGKKNEESFIKFSFIISGLLVGIALLAGIFLLFLGIKDAEYGLILGGVIFTFGSLTFVLAALTIKGCFDKAKIDVLGLYAGAVIAVIGIGFILFMCKGPVSSAGVWIIIPILMMVAGFFQVVKCIKNRK